ncbi:MAG: DUF1416 domain-containing protein [Actinobacteria bacterium]|nr:DUF1416 domain-containing protein [Actinomycetota bacterium]MDA2981877.1 DUF1416 domain-containing protein [Actinomycetota bacterium]MDA2997206.1 DUF1416 domain-containing protein [Actinomycetota bacterium]
MRTCGATSGGPDLAGVDLANQSVIQGAVLRGGVSDGVPNGLPVDSAYVRLLDSNGEFTAEVPTNLEGQFRFFAAPGSWTVVVLAFGAREEIKVQAEKGTPVDLVIQI